MWFLQSTLIKHIDEIDIIFITKSYFNSVWGYLCEYIHVWVQIALKSKRGALNLPLLGPPDVCVHSK